MTLSAWLHTPMAPDWGRLRSVTLNSALPSSDTSKRSLAAITRSECHLSGLDRRLLAAELAALALVHAVEAHRIVERIGAHDVIVVGALRPEHAGRPPGRGVPLSGLKRSVASKSRVTACSEMHSGKRRSVGIAGRFRQRPAVRAVGIGDGLPVGRPADAGHALGAGDPAVGRGERHDELGGGGRGEEEEQRRGRAGNACACPRLCKERGARLTAVAGRRSLRRGRFRAIFKGETHASLHDHERRQAGCRRQNGRRQDRRSQQADAARAEVRRRDPGRRQEGPGGGRQGLRQAQGRRHGVGEVGQVPAADPQPGQDPVHRPQLPQACRGDRQPDPGLSGGVLPLRQHAGAAQRQDAAPQPLRPARLGSRAHHRDRQEVPQRAEGKGAGRDRGLCLLQRRLGARLAEEVGRPVHAGQELRRHRRLRPRHRDVRRAAARARRRCAS